MQLTSERDDIVLPAFIDPAFPTWPINTDASSLEQPQVAFAGATG